MADGYCNNRILKFNAAGRILRVIPQPPEFLSLQVPHGLTLLEHLDLICIADRENMRVVCPRYLIEHKFMDQNPFNSIQSFLIYFVFFLFFDLICRAGLKTSLDEGTPAATIQEPDLGRVFDVAAYGEFDFLK